MGSKKKHKIRLEEDGKPPLKSTKGAFCYDAFADVEEISHGTLWNHEGEKAYISRSFVSIPPGQTMGIPLGFRIELLPGYEMQVRSRSGLAKKGIVVANCPGCVDEDYRGIVAALIRNNSDETFDVAQGDRIAQISFAKRVEDEFEVVKELSNTERGERGFGSTGI